MTNRFHIEIRDGSNKLLKVESGYYTREDADRTAKARQAMIDGKGWRMKAYVTEDHAVS